MQYALRAQHPGLNVTINTSPLVLCVQQAYCVRVKIKINYTAYSTSDTKVLY